MINHDDLFHKHENNCMFKDSSHLERRDIHKSKIDDEMVEVEYDVYCSCCGRRLWNFSWGYEEMY